MALLKPPVSFHALRPLSSTSCDCWTHTQLVCASLFACVCVCVCFSVDLSMFVSLFLTACVCSSLYISQLVSLSLNWSVCHSICVGLSLTLALSVSLSSNRISHHHRPWYSSIPQCTSHGVLESVTSLSQPPCFEINHLHSLALSFFLFSLFTFSCFSFRARRRLLFFLQENNKSEKGTVCFCRAGFQH